MVDLSEWIWLGVVVLWLVVKVLPRLLRAKASREAPPTVPAPAPGEPEHMGDVAPRPINPK